MNFSSLRITAKKTLILTRVYSTTFSSGEFTGEACVRLPYTVWSKGELGLEIRGLPEGVVLKNPSEMGEATLDAIIDKSGSIYFVHLSDVNDNHVGVGEGKKVEKRKRKKRDGMKSKESSKETGSKKKKGYDKCSAFCCQEPGVDETGMVDWILCDICNNWYHWDCIGIEKNPSGAFNCGCNSSYFTPG